METRPFSNEYHEVAPLYGLTPAELRNRSRDRWIAIDAGKVVAAAETLLRPDHRLFASLRGEPSAAPALARRVARAMGTSLYAIGDEGSALAAALVSGGFSIEITNERFVVPFETALRLVRRSSVPHRYALMDVGQCDHDRLFDLDNAVRNLVPGTDGWTGNRDWFDDELTDPASYWVATDRATDDYVGLARMWKNPSSPRFGLIGVLPEHRHPSPAAGLLRATLEEAATWGFETFTTETALTNRVVHPRLSKIGSPNGRFHQLVLKPDA